MNINTLAALTNPKMILFGMITFIAAEFFLRLILKKDKYNWKEASSSLGVAWGYVFFEMGVLPVKFIVLSWLWKFRLFDIDMNSLWNFFLLFLAADFCYYWTHRLSHNSHWFWLSHSIHHSSTQLTMATSYRLGWTHYLSGGGIFWAPLVLIGFPPLYVILTVTLVISYQLWLHTELVPKIPYIELIINTPSTHKIHHSVAKEDLNKNFAGVFSFMDILFGTFKLEEPNKKYIYGLGNDRPVSYNPFKIALYDWFLFFKKFPRKKSLKDKLKYSFGPPPNLKKEKIQSL